MYIYLTYLATVIASYLSNTLNYVVKKKEISDIKKRTLLFKKNLSGPAKRTIMETDLIPALYYLGSSIGAMVPVANIFIPEDSMNLYYDVDMNGLAKEYYKLANEQEIIQRYSNGISIKVLEKMGFNIPEEYKIVNIKPDDLKINPEIQEELEKVICELITPLSEEEVGLDSINPISNKEFRKREKRILRLNRGYEMNN